MLTWAPGSPLTEPGLIGINGAKTWCGWGILAHNSIKIAILTI